MIISAWKVFEKADKPGWACLIPIYNISSCLRSVDRPGGGCSSCSSRSFNLIFAVILCIDLAKASARRCSSASDYLPVGFIFYPILAFGDASYLGAPAR